MAPMCQPRSPPASDSRSHTFEVVSIPVGLTIQQYADGDGCSKLVMRRILSRLECALVCSVEHQDWCVAFYFNEAEQECRLVLYTDATIDMGDAIDWEKFIKK